MNTCCCKKFIQPPLKKIILVIFIFGPVCIHAQQSKTDSLSKLIAAQKEDTSKILLLEELGQAYRDENKKDSSVLSYKHALAINEKHNYSLRKQCGDISTIDYVLYEMGNYTESLNYASRQLTLSRNLKDTFQMGFSHAAFGHNYKALGEYRQSLNHYFKARQIFKSYFQNRKEPENDPFIIQCIGDVYLKMNQLDSALIFTRQSLAQTGSDPGNKLYSLRILGDIYFANRDYKKALNYYREYIPGFIKNNKPGFIEYKQNSRDLGFVYNSIAKVFQITGQLDSANFYAKKALGNAQTYQDQQNIYDAATSLYNFYKEKGALNYNKPEKAEANTQAPPGTKIDSLKKLISKTTKDTAKIDLYEKLGEAYYNEKKMDSSVLAYQRALELNEKNNYSLQKQCWNMAAIDYKLYEMGNYTESLKYASRELELNKKLKDTLQFGIIHLVFGNNYKALGEYKLAINHYFKAKQFFKLYWKSRNQPEDNTFTIQCIGETYLKMHELDSALIYTKQANKLALSISNGLLILLSTRILGDIYFAKGDDETALQYYRQYIPDFVKYKEKNRDFGFVLNNMAKIFQKRNQKDSAVFYAGKALSNAREYHDQENIYSAASSLSNLYNDNNSKDASDLLYQLYNSRDSELQALRYFKIAAAAKDSMASMEKIRQIQNLTFDEQMREKQQAETDAKEAARTKLIITIAAIIVLIISFLLWNRIRQLRLKHKMILDQKEAEKLRAIDKMKEKFFTNITHELRTPLSLIMSPAAFYLQHPEELHDMPKFLESIYKNSGYLLNLINELLDISKLDVGKMNIALSKGNFGNFVGDLAKTFEDDAIKKQIKLHFENALTGEFLFDQEHWKKIINNLLGNALKFTPANGDVFIHISKISGSNVSGNIQLIVKDTGIGIDKDQIPFITDRFYQADNKLSRSYEGAGIGLALVSELVKLMNGKFDIASEKGNGSVFTITLPLLYADGKQGFPQAMHVTRNIQFPNKDAANAFDIKEHQENSRVILIAEDNKDLRDFLHDSITPLYKVLTATDGQEGYQLALSGLPDIIISDVMMPVMDGFDFCDKIKANPATSHIPFIILSAKTTYESRIAGLQKGADDYITKPFSVEELRAKIKNILHGQEQLRKRYLEQLIHEDTIPSLSGMQDEFLKKTFRIIEEHIDDSDLSTEFLAAKMELDNNVLNRKFSFLIGLSANELIRQYKIKKEKMEHQMLELEAKALRAQMNPHFIFNCMNSIKSLIQQKDEEKAVNYLTTFSKLLRTILQNSDKREITLFDEIETCKLYTQLESMRFGNKFRYTFAIDGSIDMKSLLVPALIIQPFIENAIWHGIMPKEEGGTLTVSITKKEDAFTCIIDDDGIGRETSKQNKFKGEPSTHQSKGVHLTQSRLDLDNALNQRNASVEIVDKKDKMGTTIGTKVILNFNEY